MVTSSPLVSTLLRTATQSGLLLLLGGLLVLHACGDAAPQEPITQKELVSDAGNADRSPAPEGTTDAKAIETKQEVTPEPTKAPDHDKVGDSDAAESHEPVPEATSDQPGQPEARADTTTDTSAPPDELNQPEPSPEPSVPETSPPRTPMWLGVGNFGLRARTFDGVKWEKQGGTGSGNQHTPDLLREVAYGDGVLIAVGGHNNPHIMRSADYGKTWKDVGFKTGGWLGGVVYAGGVWFAAKGYSGDVLRSDDKGLTWKPVDMSKSEVKRSSGVRQMDAYQGKILSFGDKGTLYVSHDKGLTWLDHSLKTTTGLAFVVHFKGTWFAGGGSTCVSSKDLKTWKNCPFAIKNVYSGIISGGQFTLYHNDRYDTRFKYTTDGTKWTDGKAPVYSAYKAGGMWVGMRYGAVYTGPSLDKLTKKAGGPGGFRDWLAVGK